MPSTNRLKCMLFSVVVIFCFVSIYKILGAHNNYTATEKDTCCKANAAKDEPLDRFCVVITVFSRTDLTLQLLKHFSKLPRLSRIIIVWNNKDITPPLEKWDELGQHSVPVHFKVQERNSLMNKLQLFPEIDTPGSLL